MQIIVSLTTWSKRIGSCKQTLDSIINQTRKPDSIEINLSYEQFPHGMADVPDFLKAMPVKIYWKENDQHVWDKIMPTAHRHVNEDCIIITLDDDVNYPPTYLEEIEKNMEGNDWMCSQYDDITKGQYMVYGRKAIEAFVKHIDDDFMENIPLDDHGLYWVMQKYGLKRAKKIDAICEDRQQGYSFRRFFVDGYDDAELKDTTCDYPHREFVKERNYLHMRGIV